MEDFAVGQRWISDTETDLGLGTILEVEHRQIAIVFLATGDMRRYAKETAPLTRVAFAAGDTVTSHEGWTLTVSALEVDDGVITYIGLRSDTGETTALDEGDLDNFLRFRTPRDRLFAGLIDGNRWFNLRRQVFEYRDRIARSPIHGLQGARVTVLPHQIHVAAEALSRQTPRLLLADEVGLGKTIEAGLILHAKLVRREINRVLIAVPEPLLHQWLVEMLRKFNLRFALYDTDRFEAAVESAPDGNPFLAEQLVLISTQTLTETVADINLGDAAMAAGFDMLVVDEAHHLEGESYALVAELAAVIDSILLLTATPEQLGKSGHFARLRLLDPARFSDESQFAEEESQFEQVAAIASRLDDAQALDDNGINELERVLDRRFSETERNTLSSDTAMLASELPKRLVNDLVDRHGTGRLLFRNTRRAVPGFPNRRYRPSTLEDDSPQGLANWLQGFLSETLPDKVLFIASRRETVQAVAEQLRQLGIDTAQFHEDMSIVERDRAAAWFADPEDSCRLLLCSEIGSEGRNFQFLHRLVTVELPTSPDVLEQRIGRLDRIGQQHDVEIHVPVVEGSRDARLASWYHDGLNAFESLCQTGNAVRESLAATLDEAIDGNGDMAPVIAQSQELATRLAKELEAGRDRLLELNSNRPERIQEHLDAFARADRDFTLEDFLASVFDRFGVDVSEQAGDYWILKPSDNMQLERFPHLPDDGLSVTFTRSVAVEREDLVFLTWDHPMVSDAMDLILDEGFGQADCQVIRSPELTPGLAIVDGSYALECVAPPELGLTRFLPARVQSWQIGLDKADWTERFDSIDVDAIRVKYDRNQLRQVAKRNRGTLEQLIDRTAELAREALPELVAEARAQITAEHTEAHDRLSNLARVNPSVNPDELVALDTLRDQRLAALDHSDVRPVSVRVLFNN